MATANKSEEEATNWEEHPSVINLRNYLRIASVQPNVNYDECIIYLKGQAESLGLPHQTFEVVPKKPILVMTWEGTEPTLPAILLNSHMDVVPVFEKSWSHPPFAAHMDPDGTIYARGVQDMKSVGVQYIEAIKALKAAGARLKRTVHLSFVPDEEVGGKDGMAAFVKTEHYRKLNIGFSLDEGLASPSSDYEVFYAERNIWHMNVICPGKSGHGSLLHDDTAGEKIRYIIDKFLDLRTVHKKRLESNPDLTIGDVTTVNLTMLSGGIQDNVVPETLTATFDVRLALDVNQQEFEEMVNRWCQEAGKGVRIEYTQKEPKIESTKLDDSNPFWLAFKRAADDLKLTLKQRVFAGGTDSRYIRELGVPALGFSPMSGTPRQLHEHNESLKAGTFLRGIRAYETIIPALANVAG